MWLYVYIYAYNIRHIMITILSPFSRGRGGFTKIADQDYEDPEHFPVCSHSLNLDLESKTTAAEIETFIQTLLLSSYLGYFSVCFISSFGLNKKTTIDIWRSSTRRPINCYMESEDDEHLGSCCNVGDVSGIWRLKWVGYGWLELLRNHFRCLFSTATLHCSRKILSWTLADHGGIAYFGFAYYSQHLSRKDGHCGPGNPAFEIQRCKIQVQKIWRWN